MIVNSIIDIIIIEIVLVSIVNANYDKYYLDDSVLCRKTSNSVPIGHQSYESAIVVMAVQPSNSYRPSLKCTLLVRAPNGFGVIVTKRMLNLRNETIIESISSKRKSQSVQTSDQLVITLDQNRVKTFMGSDFEESVYVSDENEVSLTFTTSSSKNSSFGKNFELIFTAFAPTDSTGQCFDQNDWFNCGDNRCVAKSLICDNITNCGTNSDEDENLCGKWCTKNKQLFWSLFVIGWAISTFFIVLTSIICLIYRRLCFVIFF